MKRAIVVVICSSLLAACSSSTPSGGPTGPTAPTGATPPSSPTPIGPSFSPTPATPTPIPLPSPSGKGFCTDRSLVGDAVSLVKRADETFRQVALFVGGVEDIIRNDAAGASSSTGAFKIHQLAISLETLRKSVLGAAANYPDDFSVREWTGALPRFTDKVAAANHCQP